MEFQTDDWVPRLKMEFQTEEQAWLYWVSYSTKMGFSVRKHYSHKSRVDGAVISRVFVCCNEGIRKKGTYQAKKPRRETRTGCQVRLSIKLNRETNKFEVVDFVSDHNHPLRRPEACHLLPNQHELSENGNVEDRKDMIATEDTRLDTTFHNSDLCRKFAKIAAKAACTEELSAFIDGELDKLDKQLEEKMRKTNKEVGKVGKQTESCVEKMRKTNIRKAKRLSDSETKGPNEEAPNFPALNINEPSQGENGCYIELEDKCNIEITFDTLATP